MSGSWAGAGGPRCPKMFLGGGFLQGCLLWGMHLAGLLRPRDLVVLPGLGK